MISGTLAVEPSKRWNILRIVEQMHKIRNGEVIEEIKSTECSDYMVLSNSLRSVKTPEPTIKFPNIRPKRNQTVPKKKK